MSFLDKLLGRFRDQQEVIEHIADPQKDFVPANRYMRRANANWLRRRGAGYTRSMRKGRTKRHA